MIVDGRKIASECVSDLARQIQSLPRRLSLAVFVGDSSVPTRTFIGIKVKTAHKLGVSVHTYPIVSDDTTPAIAEAIAGVAKCHDGIIVQFPVPAGIDADVLRNAIPLNRDVDAVSDAATRRLEMGTSNVLPPVVGAIDVIARDCNISFSGKHVVVIGTGRLVGAPAAVWAESRGARVTVLDRNSRDISYTTKQADIIISGAGSPGLIRPDMVVDGVVIFDAGTSEAAGKLAGDVDPACAEKASLFTPVPGGIGPITVAMIFKNLLTLAA